MNTDAGAGAGLPGRGRQEATVAPVTPCPVRPGDGCSLCLPGVSGPGDCGLVYLVMSDPDLRERRRLLRGAPPRPGRRASSQR